MSKRGLELLLISLDELKAPGQKYFLHFLNQEEAAIYIPKMFELLEWNDENEVFTLLSASKMVNLC